MSKETLTTGGIISSIEPDSIAEEFGWQPGDEIISINGHVLRDLLDFRFYVADEHLIILVRRGIVEAEFEVEKDYETDLGVSFKDALFDGIRTCGAHCIFCFVEQLPKGMRKTLYVKDDDYRLSFLHGNFITLGNVSDDELQRIVTQRLSPLYISVHTTNSELREKMIGRKAPNILRQIDTLAEGHITLHTQIVLCRGINDGDYLDRTVEDLARRYPTVQSIAIVPAGLSMHRRNKTPIGSIDAQYSLEILNKLKHWQHECLAKYGTRLVWAADEFYLSVGRPVPLSTAYEGFPQIENGIGLVRKFKDSARRAKKLLPEKLSRPITVSVITGQLAAPLLREWAKSVSCKNLNIRVFPITNRLFGETITVTGLVAGRDIIDQLTGRDIGDVLYIPRVSLRDDTFLDDVTVQNVENALGVPVRSVAPLPYALIKNILSVADD